jgi:hypothetical protein
VSRVAARCFTKTVEEEDENEEEEDFMGPGQTESFTEGNKEHEEHQRLGTLILAHQR